MDPLTESLTLQSHLPPDFLAEALRADVTRRADRDSRSRCRRSGSTTSAAASCSRRSPGCRSTTRPGPSGRSWSRTRPRSPPATGARDAGRARLRLGREDPAADRRAARARHAGRRTCRWTSARRRCWRAAGRWSRDYPGLLVRALLADFEHQLDVLPVGDRRLTAFLGGTIGNLEPGPRAAFLAALRGSTAAGDWLLLGTDLVKDPAVLVPAYDDAAGVTARFNKNVLDVVNRELAADFDPDAFEHVAALGPGRGVDRDAAALDRRAEGHGRRARPGRAVRRPARRCAPRCRRSSGRRASGPSWPRPGSRPGPAGPTAPAGSWSPWPRPSDARPAFRRDPGLRAR